MGTKRTGMEDTADTSNGTICRTNRFFIQVKGYGHCDDREKTIMGVGISKTKLVAAPDWPLSSLIRGIMEMTMSAMDYSSEEAMRADLKRFQKWVAGLDVK